MNVITKVGRRGGGCFVKNSFEITIHLSMGVAKGAYEKGQLFGFTTKPDVRTLYSIFGRQSACIDYSLRRITEGAGGHLAVTSPLLSRDEIDKIVENSNLNETLSSDEIERIAKAVQFNVQDARVEVARSNVRRHF